MVTLRTCGVRRKELERVTQLPQRRLDDAHVAAVLHVLQQLERVLDDVGDALLVVPAALVDRSAPEFSELTPDPPKLWCFVPSCARE